MISSFSLPAVSEDKSLANAGALSLSCFRKSRPFQYFRACVKSGTGILPVCCAGAGTYGNNNIRKVRVFLQDMGKMPMPRLDGFSYTLLLLPCPALLPCFTLWLLAPEFCILFPRLSFSFFLPFWPGIALSELFLKKCKNRSLHLGSEKRLYYRGMDSAHVVEAEYCLDRALRRERVYYVQSERMLSVGGQSTQPAGQAFSGARPRIPHSSYRIYAHRAFGGDSRHNAVDGVVAAGTAAGKKSGQGRCLSDEP